MSQDHLTSLPDENFPEILSRNNIFFLLELISIYEPISVRFYK